MKLKDPFNKEELKSFTEKIKELLSVNFNSIDESDFFQKPDKGWSPAENLQHINKVTKLLSLTFLTPKLLVTFVFGRSSKPTRRFQEVSDIYLDALSKGQNSGPFTPGSENPKGNRGKRKEELIGDINKYLDKYKTALNRWSEDQLDQILMPHPFLGKIPAREMYMIGLLHSIHHSKIISKRLNLDWKFF